MIKQINNFFQITPEENGSRSTAQQYGGEGALL